LQAWVWQRSQAQFWRWFAARVQVDLGHTYLWEQRWTEAAEAYRQSAALHDTAEAHNFLGDALQGSGDVQGAIREYNQAIRMNPLYVEPRNGLARVYVGQEHYQEAVDAYIEARHRHLLRDRAAAFTYYGLGDALFTLGCDAAAAEQYERAVDIDRSFEGARYDWALGFACPVPIPRPPDNDPGYPWRPGSLPDPPDTRCIASTLRDRKLVGP
jgi:tetratricopeptide (TPR) repeat protein